MNHDTAGNLIYEPSANCACGLTGGCQKCNPLPSFIGCISDEEAEEMKKKVKDYKIRLNKSFEKRKEKNKKLFQQNDKNEKYEKI